MARRRDSEIELDFDGLADSLTDLVGTLTLFVFLLFVLSEEIRPLPPAPNVQRITWDDPGKKRLSAEFLRELNMLESQLAALDGAVKHEESEIAPLRDRLQALARKAGAPPAKSP